MLGKHVVKLRGIMRDLAEGARLGAVLDEGAPAFRASRAEVDKAIEAMLSGPQVKPKLAAIVGKDGDVEALLAELRQSLQPILVNCIQRVGGKVSGASASTVKTALRGMAQGGTNEGLDEEKSRNYTVNKAGGRADPSGCDHADG